MNVPQEIIKNLFLFSVPEEKLYVYQKHYEFIREKYSYHQLNFPFEDFLIAYLAAENIYGVVSYDAHILYKIRKYLDYEAYFPEDIIQLPADSMIFLDSNIFLSFYDNNISKQKQIISMFSLNQSVTFLIPENIVSEIERVYKKLEKFAQNKKNLMKNYQPTQISDEVQEEDLNQFIEDFHGYQSNNRAKKQKKLLIKKKKYYRGQKWLASPRFRNVYQDIIP